MKNLNSKKILGTLALGAFLVTGFYNALVLNSDSQVSASSFAKRLDEVYGVVIPGRTIASNTTWHKLTPVKTIQLVEKSNIPSVAKVNTAPEAVAEAAVQEELSLNLIEVINSQKWEKGLGTSQFVGNIVASNGTIESLNVSLPNGLGLSVSFSELTGNVFEYDLDGQQFSGMLYQVDTNSYMVSLTNGPLEGTRMRFGGAPVLENQEQIDMNLAQNHNLEVGTFGTEQMTSLENDAPAANMQAAVFNFDAPTI